MLKKCTVIIYGAGISGRGAAGVLADKGFRVYLYNDTPCAVDRELLDMLKATGGALVLGEENMEWLLGEAQLMVLSPGVSPELRNVVAAETQGLEVISEIELGSRLYQGHTAAITGTNGKTTTTSIVGAMFKRLSVPSAVGGNIGLAFSKEVEHLDRDSWFAAEISSFQLEKVKDFCPEIAVVLNLTPDHMERHHTMEAYARAKQNVFRRQDSSCYTVLNYDDPVVRSWAALTSGQVCFFSRKEELSQGIFMRGRDFVIKWKDDEITLISADELKLFGGHNEENVLAAIACGYFAGVAPGDMADVLRSFESLEHRLEYVATVRGVPYYNDSKATNTDSAIKALEAFSEGHLVLIAGGHDKLTPLEPLMELAREKTEALILLGEARERFFKAAQAAQVRNVILASSFEDAVRKAWEIARPPQAVLLSPACSSYDMFRNYPERGRRFKQLVRELPL